MTEQKYNAHNTLMVLDLHGVIFKHDYKRMLKTFLQSPLKWHLVKLIFNPYFLKDVITLLWYHHPIPEAFFITLSHNHPHMHASMPLIIQIANCQKINRTVVEIIKELKKRGYELALCSNIGVIIYQDFAQKHPDIFTLFDHIIVATPATHYVGKPTPAMYQRLFTEANPLNKQIILIDDKRKNLAGGIPFNIVGILFHNAAQLKKELVGIGIHLI